MSPPASPVRPILAAPVLAGRSCLDVLKELADPDQVTSRGILVRAEKQAIAAGLGTRPELLLLGRLIVHLERASSTARELLRELDR